MATHTTVIIYVDDKPYQFKVTINRGTDNATYHVRQEVKNGHHLDLLPDEFTLEEGGKLISGEGINMVEQEQLVRLIWQEIRSNGF